MGSRIRENPSKVYECFIEVAAGNGSTQAPWVLQKFPDSYHEEEILKLVSHFCYPCEINCSVVQVFSFVLTGVDGKWTFGYCRHTPNASTALCILSSLPWHETFYELLNRIAEITQREEATDLADFLEALNAAEVPEPGGELVVTYNRHEYTFHCSDHTKLPSIPENRNVTEYFNAIDAQNMMIIFASMLNERRVMITSKKLSRLSACVQSANALIYPMFWQHIFIPVLPYKLIDYLSAPMPFLIGVPALVLEKAKQLDLSDIVILYADDNKVETPFDDFQSLPPEVVSSLKKRLKNSTAMLGDKVAQAFLHSLVQLIGGYSDALNYGPGNITFNHDAFIQTRTPSMQPYLERMHHLQIFQQFIEGRLEMLNSGEGFKDDFEVAVNAYADKNSTKIRNQYRDWMSNMKKEGGALLKSVKNKANPAMKHAYKSVKDRSKKAYKGMRSKFQELQQKDNASDSMPVRSGVSKTPLQPRSAPSSPTLLQRPVTFHGLKSVNTSRSSSNIKLTHNDGDSTPLTPRQYNLLETNDVVDREAGSESDAGILSQNSSPNLSMTRISMDLMGDLQDIIFRRCSIGDFSSNEHSRSTSPEAVPQEPLLIQLDTEEAAEEIFDPLLAKEKQTTQPPAARSQLASNPTQLFPAAQTKAVPAGFQTISNSYVVNCSSGLMGSSPNVYQQPVCFNPTTFATYSTPAPLPLPSRNLQSTVLPTCVPSASNPFQSTVGVVNPSFLYNNTMNPFTNYAAAAATSNASQKQQQQQQNSVTSSSSSQLQDPFQDVAAQYEPLIDQTQASSVSNPFSNLLQWESTSTAAAKKSQWETFN